MNVLAVVAHRKGERDEMEDAALLEYYLRRKLLAEDATLKMPPEM